MFIQIVIDGCWQSTSWTCLVDHQLPIACLPCQPQWEARVDTNLLWIWHDHSHLHRLRLQTSAQTSWQRVGEFQCHGPYICNVACFRFRVVHTRFKTAILVFFDASLRASSKQTFSVSIHFLFYIHLFHVSFLKDCFLCLARCGFRLLPSFRWDALWGIFSDVTLPYLTLKQQLGISNPTSSPTYDSCEADMWFLSAGITHSYFHKQCFHTQN